MPFKDEEVIEPVALSSSDIENIQQILDRIIAQIDDKKPINLNILLSVDFEKVKQRIDNITDQLEEVQRRFKS